MRGRLEASEPRNLQAYRFIIGHSRSPPRKYISRGSFVDHVMNRILAVDPWKLEIGSSRTHDAGARRPYGFDRRMRQALTRNRRRDVSETSGF